MYFSLSITIVCASLIGNSYASFGIDRSCTAQQAAFIKLAMAGAQDMAVAGIEAATPDGSGQYSHGALIDLLFGTNRPAIGKHPPGRVGAASRILEVLGAVRTFRDFDPNFQSQPGNPVQRLEPSQFNVMIYCDQSRIITRSSDLFHQYDTDVGEAVPLSQKIQCQKGTFGFTTNPLKYHQIQLCPWFLGYAIQKKYQTRGDWSWKLLTWGALKLDKIVTGAFFTDVDLMSLFDKVLLHELTHTTSGGDLIDVSGDLGTAYGWKNCRKLAATVGDPTFGALFPDDNADTFALFASMSLMVKKGMTLNPDGSFVGWKGQPGVPLTKRAVIAVGSLFRA